MNERQGNKKKKRKNMIYGKKVEQKTEREKEERENKLEKNWNKA